MKKLFPIGLVILVACLTPPASPDPAVDTQVTNPYLSDYNVRIDYTDIKPGDADQAADHVINKIEEIVKEILAVSDEDRTFDNTMLRQDDISAEMGMALYPIYLMANVHPDETVRNEANDAVIKMENYSVELGMREDIYEAVIAYSKSEEAKTLKGEKKKFLDDSLIGYKRSGFGLDKEIRDKVKELSKILSSLSQTWNKNLNTYRDTLFVSEEEISGLPEAYKLERKQENGTYAIDLSYPSYRPFMRLADSEKARKELQIKYLNRASETNMPVLDSMIIVRNELATTLGYKTYSEYVTEVRMVKTPAVVWDFENNLQARLKEKAQGEYNELLALKTKELGAPADVINYWESSYYLNKLKIQKYNVDGEVVKQYFEINNVLDGLFYIYQTLLSVEFKKVDNPDVWYDDVTMYQTIDKETGKLLGEFYLDLYPRDAKYGHAAHFSVRKGKILSSGEYLVPVSSLVCNFPKPTEYSKSLLTHDQVETFFHEFGHLMHNQLNVAETWGYSGTSVPRDFVEAPSQMLENWIWNKESLSLFAKHNETGEPFPDELLENMIAAKNVYKGNETLQQVFYGTLDFTLYDGFDPRDGKSTTDVVRELQNSITLLPYVEGTSFQTNFGHLDGYASSYYGYLWSLVIAQDLFSKFEENGIMNVEQGRKYRDIILAPGGSREPMDLIEEYLGRKPDNAAFFRDLGLN